jgi:hypothetical protein
VLLLLCPVTLRAKYYHRRHFLDAFVGESGTGRSGELDETDAIILVHLPYVFLTGVATVGNVVGVQVICRVGIVRGDPECSLQEGTTQRAVPLSERQVSTLASNAIDTTNICN